MGIYKNNAEELAEKIIDCLDNNTEGDYDLSELQKAFITVENKMKKLLSVKSGSEKHRKRKLIPALGGLVGSPIVTVKEI